MKKMLMAVALFAFTGSYMATYATANEIIAVDCDHCKKDHKCDDKCKKGENGELCKAAASADAKSKCSAEAKACCKKGDAKACCKKGDAAAVKSCHGKEKAEATEQKTPEL